MPISPPLIVLVHGLMVSDALTQTPVDPVAYWADIPSAIRSALGDSVEVVTLALPAAGSVAERAQALANLLAAATARQDREIHLLTHSMGALDARRAITTLGWGPSRGVRSLTTIGGPHLGSPVADLAVAVGGWALDWLASHGWDDQAAYNLTTEFCCEFNEATPDVAGVAYRYVAGAFSPAVGSVWDLPYAYCAVHGGPNDGLVAVESALRGGTPASGSVLWWETNHADELSQFPPPFGDGESHAERWVELVRTAVGVKGLWNEIDSF